MRVYDPRGKVVDNPAPSIRSGATLAAYRIARDIIQPRLRVTILPPTIAGSRFPTGSALLWLTDDDTVGFMFGTALSPRSKGEIRGLFQDGLEYSFTLEEQFRLSEQLFNVGTLNYFSGDLVVVRIHTDQRVSGTVTEILKQPEDTARVKLDTGESILSPFSHMVLIGPDLTIPQIQSFYNTAVLRWLTMNLGQWLRLDVQSWQKVEF